MGGPRNDAVAGVGATKPAVTSKQQGAATWSVMAMGMPAFHSADESFQGTPQRAPMGCSPALFLKPAGPCG